MSRFLPLFALLFCLPDPPETIQTLTGKVVGLSDGDTVTVLVDRKQVKVRLEGIDAPERKQSFGTVAKDTLSELIFRKEVTLNKTGEDKYGRTLGRIVIDGQDASEYMVAKGMAWHFKKYSTDETLAKLEEKARSEKIGIWSEPNPLPPWEFRDRSRLKAEDLQSVMETPRGYGEPTPTELPRLSHWLNTSSNVRHNARCEHFNNTVKGRACGPDDGKACKKCGG